MHGAADDHLIERINSRISVTAYSPEVIGEAVNAKENFVEGNGGRRWMLRHSACPLNIYGSGLACGTERALLFASGV